jgi:hypothetical protein
MLHYKIKSMKIIFLFTFLLFILNTTIAQVENLAIKINVNVKVIDSENNIIRDVLGEFVGPGYPRALIMVEDSDGHNNKHSFSKSNTG